LKKRENNKGVCVCFREIELEYSKEHIIIIIIIEIKSWREGETAIKRGG